MTNPDCCGALVPETDFAAILKGSQPLEDGNKVCFWHQEPVAQALAKRVSLRT